MGVRRCIDCLGRSLHPLKNFELVSSVTLTRLHKSAGSPEHFADHICYMISSCSNPVIKKKIHVHCIEVLHVAHTCVCVLLI